MFVIEWNSGKFYCYSSVVLLLLPILFLITPLIRAYCSALYVQGVTEYLQDWCAVSVRSFLSRRLQRHDCLGRPVLLALAMVRVDVFEEILACSVEDTYQGLSLRSELKPEWFIWTVRWMLDIHRLASLLKDRLGASLAARPARKQAL
jgi:hypothetical protein